MLSNPWSSGGRNDLMDVIRRVRNRWRLRIALRGAAVLLAAGGSVITLDGAPLTYGKPGFENPHFVARGRARD